MRKAICLILVVAICMSMACTVFAAKTSSAADGCKPSGTPSTSNPKTGDMIVYWVLLMVLALLALAVVVFLYRKFAL